MSAAASLFAILGALLIGAMSPGPSFVLVSRTAVTRSRAHGLAAAAGMGLGAAMFALLALAGLVTLLREAPTLHLALKIGGGLYLMYIAWRIWRGAAEPLAGEADGLPAAGALRRSFCLAFITQVSNPKAAVVYGSVFAALLPTPAPAWLLAVLAPAVFILETGWYVLVALAFSAPGPRALYAGWKAWIDRAAAAVMGALGLRLVYEALSAKAV
ncbi:LysE family translocator [Phenylobacterium sp. VNQ135]|uniref:LysE family translocator n=1 Tax=Phenylobacterium sp. VNQ135 TaxID=3400922 RepID=UPI003C01A64D